MSNKSKAKAAKSLPGTLDTSALAARADAELAQSRFKEAAELYKTLLKRERRAAWLDGLAACYAGRAQALAAKSMFQEALVLWRNREQLCGKPLFEGPYLTWLIQAGELGEAVRLLADPALPDTGRTELETQFAGMLLSLPNDALPVLPAESSLLRHRPAALSALRACQQGDLAGLNESLAAIPFRSPYRDLKPLLKALALLPTDHAAAAEAVARLPENSPFERLAAVLRAAVLPDTQWLAALHNLDVDSRHLLLDLKGCPDALRPLLIDLARLGEQPHPETWFDFLLRHRRTLPAGLAESLCQRLLPHAESRLKHFIDVFGRPTPARLEHLAALAFEARHKPSLALPHWRRLAEMLTGDASQKQRAALIWRRLSGIDIAALGDEDVLADSINCLQRSVELDPDVRETQLRLIAALRRQGELQQARGALDRALPRFPKDAELLLEAVQVALASKAFKKAVGLAKQVLEIDPINPKVRRLVGQAHFSHARKQFKARNPAAADKELDAAAEWLRTGEASASLDLLRALIQDNRTSHTAIQAAVASLGGGLAGAFHLVLEAGRLGLDAASLLPRSGVDLKSVPAPAAVKALAQALDAAREEAGKAEIKKLRSALLPFLPVLKRAAAGSYTEADMIFVCEAFFGAEAIDLLRLYADAALKRWPARPLFVYFKAASFADTPYLMPLQLRNDLDRAAEKCRQNDRRTCQRIESLFHAYEDDMPIPDDGDDFIGNLDTADPGVIFEMMLQMGGEEMLFSTVRKTIGKAAFDALRKELGGSNKDFARALIEVMAQEARSLAMPPPFKPSVPIPLAPKPGARKPASDIQRDLFDD